MANTHGDGAFGRYLAGLRHARGMTQDELAAELNSRSGTHSMSRAEIARYERQRRIPMQWLPLLADVLRVPRAELEHAAKVARGRRRQTAASVTDALRSLSLSTSDYESEDPVHRRTLLAGAVLAATTEPWGRLAYALESSPPAADASVVDTIAAHTAALYDAEEHQPSRTLYHQVAQHLDAITALLPTAPLAARTALVGLAGQAAALAGWLAYDLGDTDTAGRYYQSAAEAAHQAGDGPLFACVLAYSSYQASPADACRILHAAQEHVRGRGSATARAWLAAREAEESSGLGSREGALRALDRAHTAYDYADPGAEQPWVRFFRPARMASLTVSTLGRLRHGDVDTAADDALAASATEDAKITAVVLGDVATALVSRGDLDRGAVVARRALETTRTTEATLGRQRLTTLAGTLPSTPLGHSLRAELHEGLGA